MSWRDRLPSCAGRLAFDAPLAPYTWLRVGGPADVLFLPSDEADLASFLRALDPGVPVMVLGAGSNTLIRDGGVEGVVIRLGKAFSLISPDGVRIRAGAAALDARVARTAAETGVGGLEFLSGVPGTVGGALVMNAGCYGRETGEVVEEAYALDRKGGSVRLPAAQMGFGYRRTAAAEGLVFIGALFRGVAADPAEVMAKMQAVAQRREDAQPIREKTGGSTFKNPKSKDGTTLSAWRLVDEAGWRGRPVGGAMMSPQHANFLINDGSASAADIEGLGEAVRAAVKARSGVDLEWEIRRVGRPAAPPA